MMCPNTAVRVEFRPGLSLSGFQVPTSPPQCGLLGGCVPDIATNRGTPEALMDGLEPLPLEPIDVFIHHDVLRGTWVGASFRGLVR